MHNFPSQICLKKANFKLEADEAQSALLASRKLVSTVIRTRECAALGYPGAKISLKEDDVSTLFPVVEAMLMPPIRRMSMTMVHLGSERAHGEFGPQLVTLASEHNVQSDLGSNDCVTST